MAALARSETEAWIGKHAAEETAVPANLRHDCSTRGHNGSPLDFATINSLIVSLRTSERSTSTPERTIADTGQISNAVIAMNADELCRRIRTVSRRISSALIGRASRERSYGSSSNPSPSLLRWSSLSLGEAFSVEISITLLRFTLSN